MTKKQQLAIDQGVTFKAALDLMREDTANASNEIDDYIVTLACEEAEGMYMVQQDGSLMWEIPDPEDNLHLEVAVQDKLDGRFLPHLEVSCKLLDESDQITEEKTVPFIWHTFLFHYGTNWQIPKEGEYTGVITIKQPHFHRHDEVAGKRYLKDVIVTLGPIHLKPGRKEHGEE